jgi:hypothetical protein
VVRHFKSGSAVVWRSSTARRRFDAAQNSKRLSRRFPHFITTAVLGKTFLALGAPRGFFNAVALGRPFVYFAASLNAN